MTILVTKLPNTDNGMWYGGNYYGGYHHSIRAITSFDGFGAYVHSEQNLFELNCDASSCSWKKLPQGTEDGRSMTTFYYYTVNHQSGLQRNTFSKLSYIFFNTSKCAANYVISIEVYDGFIGQKILKL